MLSSVTPSLSNNITSVHLLIHSDIQKYILSDMVIYVPGL